MGCGESKTKNVS